MAIKAVFLSRVLIYGVTLGLAWSQETFVCPKRCRCDLRHSSVECFDILKQPDDFYSILETTPNDTTKLIIQQSQSLPPWEVSLSRQHFENLSFLQELKLVSCGIAVIHDETFVNLTNLVELNLQSNKISKLNEGTLSGLKSLTHLNLENNLLDILPSDVFQEITGTIKHITLRNNRLSSIEPFTFLSLKLTDLDLSSNENLTQITEAAFTGGLINKLDLSQLHLDSIPTKALQQLASSLTLLRLDYQTGKKFKRLDQTNFTGLNTLQELSIKSSGIQKISPNTFGSLTALKRLNLNQNDLQEIIDSAFAGARKLESLRLEGNKKLVVISKKAFGNDSNIEQLIISKCGFQRFDAGIYEQLTKLQRLDMSGNRMFTVSESASAFIQKLRLFSITRNPLHCNCELLWLWRLAKSNPSIRASCMTPQQKNMIYTKESTFTCTPPSIEFRANGVRVRRGYSVKVKVGDLMTLTCEGRGDPAPWITIQTPMGETFTRSPPTNTSVLETSAPFRLDNVRLEHGGKYTCLASNVKANRTTVLNVAVLGKAIIVNETTNPDDGDSAGMYSIKTTSRPKPNARPNPQASKDTDKWPPERYAVIVLVLIVIALILIIVGLIYKQRQGQMQAKSETKSSHKDEAELMPINGVGKSSIEA